MDFCRCNFWRCGKNTALAARGYSYLRPITYSLLLFHLFAWLRSAQPAAERPRRWARVKARSADTDIKLHTFTFLSHGIFIAMLKHENVHYLSERRGEAHGLSVHSQEEAGFSLTQGSEGAAFTVSSNLLDLELTAM